MIRICLFAFAALISCVSAPGGIATDRLRAICADATRLQILGESRDGHRPVVLTTFDTSEIDHIVALFDFIDPDVSGVAEDEIRETSCFCVYSSILELDVADGSRFTLGVVGDFIRVEPSIGLHPKHVGTLAVTDESAKHLQKMLKEKNRRTRRYRQPR